MPTSDGIRPGDVVVVPFPYADVLAEKKRPAAVIATIPERGLLWIAMITSAGNEPWSGDVPIRDLVSAGLPKPSVVRPAKIACISAERLIRRAGMLSHAEKEAVMKCIHRILAPADA